MYEICQMKLIFASLTIVFLLSGCIKFWDRRSDYIDYKVWGSKPIYSNDPALKTASIDTPHAVINAGKIYAYQHYLLQCEIGEGFHIIDNTDPKKASRIKFLKLLGANEISIKNNYLYTNSYSDLVVIDINDIDKPQIIKRVENAFAAHGFLPEPAETGYYECVDLSKGVVTGWTKDSVSYGCYKN